MEALKSERNARPEADDQDDLSEQGDSSQNNRSEQDPEEAKQPIVAARYSALRRKIEPYPLALPE